MVPSDSDPGCGTTQAGDHDGFPPTLGPPGQTLYEREVRLGGGGQAVVYRYRDVRLPRRVAVKRMRLAAGELARRERLDREAAALARIDHPGVARIHHLMDLRDTTYLILEYVEGETLRRRLEQGPLPVEEAVRVAFELAEAMEAVHAHGFVHRDVKPENIMLMRTGGVKLLDLGIAKVLADAPTGHAIGTPAYMAPEQAGGTAPVDGRADTWALGCVLYECLAGGAAFPAGFRFGEEPDWGRLPDDARDGVEDVIRACVSVRREDRPRTLADELAALIAGDRRSVRRAPIRVPCNVGDRATSFVGRATEAQTVEDALASGTRVTIRGAAGVGKSSLAREVAHRLATRGATPFPCGDGVWWVGFDDRAAPLSIAERIGAVLFPGGLSRGTEGLDAGDALVQRLASWEGLIVLDGCDGILEACRALLDALSACPGVRILATARQAIGAAGERPVPISGLDVPGPHDAPRETEAIRLFLDRARAIRPELTLGDAETRAVADICRRLDGHPLAIELAAARVAALPLVDLASHLFDVLDPRRILETTVASSLDDLAGARNGRSALALLRRITVFRGGFDLPACAAVADGVDGRPPAVLLADLVDRSLVEFQPRRSRYEMLGPVRDACLQLDADTDRSPVRDAHLVHFLALAERAAARLEAPDLSLDEQADCLDDLDLEHDNLRTALAHAQRCEDPAREHRLVRALHRFWYIRGHLAQGRAALRHAVERGAEADDLTRARLSNALGMLEEALGDAAAATEAYREAADALENHDEFAGSLAGVLTNLGKVRQDAGELVAAAGDHARALAIYRTLGQDAGVSWVRLNQGWLALEERAYADAARHAVSGLVAFCRSGDQVREAAALHILGVVAFHQGALEAARWYFERALLLRSRIGDHRYAPWTLAWLGVVQQALGQSASALRFLLMADAEGTAAGAALTQSDRDRAARARAAAEAELGGRKVLEIERMTPRLTAETVTGFLDIGPA